MRLRDFIKPFAWRTAKHGRTTMIIGALVIMTLLAPLLAGCDNSDSGKVVVVTATYTPEPRVMIVTATFTVAAGAADDNPPPTATLAQGELGSSPDQPQDEPTATEVPPTETPTETPTEPPPPTNTLVPPTNTAAPPTNTPKPKATAVPKSTLKDYKVAYGDFAGGDQGDEFKYTMWLMRGDGSQASQIMKPGFEPAFAPNGQKIIYYKPFSGIWSFDMASGADVQLQGSPYAEFGSLSPDSSRLLYHNYIGNWWSADVYIYVANADGRGEVQLPSGVRPAWSPDGSLIAFDTCRGSCGIFVMQADGGGFRQVTSDGGGKVSWAPGGNKLVYSAEPDGDPEIMTVKLDGSGMKQLTHNTGNDAMPVYSPDGNYIYFLSDQNGTGWAIRAMRSDGSDVKTVRQMGVPPRWQFSRLSVTWW